MSNDYAKIEQREDSSDGNTIFDVRESLESSQVRRMETVRWSLHLFLMAAYTIIIFAVLPAARKCSPCFNERLLGAPIYLTNIRTGVFDPYSRENPNVDEARRSLMDAHMTTITEEEKQNLPGHRDTAPAYGGEPGYAVIIEVFHQLHCLNAIRESYYSGRSNETTTGFADPGGHSDHCFSYLLQTLLCHSDVGVMTTTWVPHAQVFMADFDMTKQCRNYDAIRTWAKTRKAKHSPPQHHSDHSGGE
ncbi:protein of unknown function (DUF3328) domain containing protein [Rhypophila sp. PSN 637]